MSHQRRSHRRPHRHNAAAALVTVISLVILMGFLALTVDIGHLEVVRADLQSTADATALAAASQLPEESRVRSLARQYATMNYPDHGNVLSESDVHLGIWDKDTSQFTESNNLPNAVRVTVRRTAETDNSVKLFFAPVMGYHRSDVTATATATFGTADTWDVIIVQDISGSFTSALDLAKDADEALVNCLQSHISNESRLGMVSFTGSSFLVNSLEPLDTGFDRMIGGIRNLQSCCRSQNCGSDPSCRTGTSIAAGLDLAIDQFLAAPNPFSDIGQAIVLVSDGRPQAGTTSPPTDEQLRALAVAAADRAGAEGISIYTVYYAGSSSTPEDDIEFIAGLIRGKGTFQATPDAEDLTDMLWKICASLPLMLVE